MSICGGPKELPLEGPSGKDNCFNTQWVTVGPIPIQNEGQEGLGRPKMAA